MPELGCGSGSHDTFRTTPRTANASGELLAADDYRRKREKAYAVTSQLDWLVRCDPESALGRPQTRDQL
jgi:hypothetical protein